MTTIEEQVVVKRKDTYFDFHRKKKAKTEWSHWGTLSVNEEVDE